MWLSFPDLRTEYLKYVVSRFNLGFGQGTIDADLKGFTIWDYIYHLFFRVKKKI